MKKLRTGLLGVILFGSILLSACGAHTANKADEALLTARGAAEYTMESLKTLDLESFNECTDNYVDTHHNWIGVPVKTEYRVFNELLQPEAKTWRRKGKYEFNYKFIRKMMENLAWEIKDVKEDEHSAEITMEITNLNMADVMGKYEIYILENMLVSPGTGLSQMIKDVSNIMDDKDGLLAIVESCDKGDICTLEVTVTAYRENGTWKIHLNDEFINAFMGNINGSVYSEDVQKKLDELEKLHGEKMNTWVEEFSNDVERWTEGLFGE